jgi:hypothetical protein
LVALAHFRLNRDCAFDRIDHRGKLKQHAVPRGLDDATAVFCHESIGDLAVFAERAGGADLVEAHEPRVARHVSGDYCRQPASDPNWLLLLHGSERPSRDILLAPMPPVMISVGLGALLRQPMAALISPRAAVGQHSFVNGAQKQVIGSQSQDFLFVRAACLFLTLQPQAD